MKATTIKTMRVNAPRHLVIIVIGLLALMFLGLNTSFHLNAHAQSEASAGLQGRVLDVITGGPVAGALVSIPELNLNLLTDAQGNFNAEDILLNNEPLVVTIQVSAAGYGPWTMQNTPLYAGVTRLLGEIRLGTGAQVIEGGANFTPTEDDAAAALESLSSLILPDALSPQFFSHEVIPSTIRVGLTGYIHCRDWLNAGRPVERVIEMPFSEYVKNVLPNEWIVTWNVESLRAGAVAVKMFAWWRINLNVDGVRPQGAHVVNNTCDQVFIQNSAQSSTNAAVDDTWNHIMRANGRVVEIHYLNTDANCTRYFPNIRCMGQWGSKALADQGRSWQEILHHYYDPVQISLGSSNLPALPANTNVARNGDFSNELREWSTFGAVRWSVNNGVLGIRAENANDPGGLRQNIAYSMAAGTPLEITLQMGNSSSATKTPRVVVRSSTNPNDHFTCDFVIPPNAPLQQYVVYGLSGAWSIPRVEIWPDPADNLPDLLVDNVTISSRPHLSISVTRCYAPQTGGNWNLIADPQGWTIVSDLNNPSATEGGIRYDLTGANPALASPTMTGINAERSRHVMLRMASDIGGCAAIYFKQAGQTAFSDGQRVEFEIRPDGSMQTYQVDMSRHALWRGPISQIGLTPTCTSAAGGVMTLRSVMVLDADTMPLLQSPAGITTEPLGNPTYIWRHLNGVTTYQLYVGTEAGQQVFYDYVDARQYCNAEQCSIDLTEIDERYRLMNGPHVVYLRAWNNSQAGEWAGEFAFTLQATPPAPVSLTNTTATSSPRPIFNWELPTGAETATWFQLYVARDDDLFNPRLFHWFSRVEVCGSPTGTICTLQSPAYLENGPHSLYIQSWGPGGFSTGGIQGWAGPGRFTINGTRPDLPRNLNVELLFGRPIITWADDPAFAWAQVYIGTPEGELLHMEWHEKTAALCDGSVCQLTPAINASNPRYVVYMQMWGPGGLSAWAGPVTTP